MQKQCETTGLAAAHSWGSGLTRDEPCPRKPDLTASNSRGNQRTENVRVMALRIAAASASAALGEAPGSPRHCWKALSRASTAWSLPHEHRLEAGHALCVTSRAILQTPVTCTLHGAREELRCSLPDKIGRKQSAYAACAGAPCASLLRRALAVVTCTHGLAVRNVLKVLRGSCLTAYRPDVCAELTGQALHSPGACKGIPR